MILHILVSILLGLDLKPMFRKVAIWVFRDLSVGILTSIIDHSVMSYFCRHVEVGFEPTHCVQH